MAGTAQSPVGVVRLQPAAEMGANARHRADLAAVVDHDGVDRARGNENGVSFRELRDRRHWPPSGVKTAGPVATGPAGPWRVRTSSSATPTSAAAAAVLNVLSQTRLVKRASVRGLSSSRSVSL